MDTTLSLLAPAGSTGNVTGAAVGCADASRVAVQLVVEAVGGTPTVTWKAQGSHDGVNWYDVFYLTDASDTATAATRTATAVGAQTLWLDRNGGSRFYAWYRIVTSANTNVTFRAELIYQRAR